MACANARGASCTRSRVERSWETSKRSIRSRTEQHTRRRKRVEEGASMEGVARAGEETLVDGVDGLDTKVIIIIIIIIRSR